MKPATISEKIKSRLAETKTWEEIQIENLNLQTFEKTNSLSDIYFMSIKYKDGLTTESSDMVLKIALGDDRSSTAIWDSETEVMQKLLECRFPIPEVHCAGHHLVDDRGAFILMDKIRGRMLSDLINENIDNPGKVDNYIDLYANLMVELHNLKVDDKILHVGRKNEMFTSGNANPILIYLEDYLNFTRHIKYNTLSRILEWLMDISNNLEIPLELGITHGDFQTDNIIISDDNKLFIIDWGFARTADIRLDVHWSRFMNGFVHNRKVGDYIHQKYLQIQSRKLTDNSFFEAVAITRLLLGLSQLANISDNYKGNVDRFLNNLDFTYLEERINDISQLELYDLETDFRKVNRVPKIL